jgi:hypothetical protein
MQMLKQNIEDLKVMQSSYPSNSRGYSALNLAIVALSQLYATNEHMMSIAEPSIHWVLGETGASGTINVEPGQAWVTLED